MQQPFPLRYFKLKSKLIQEETTSHPLYWTKGASIPPLIKHALCGLLVRNSRECLRFMPMNSLVNPPLWGQRAECEKGARFLAKITFTNKAHERSNFAITHSLLGNWFPHHWGRSKRRRKNKMCLSQSPKGLQCWRCRAGSWILIYQP